MTYKLLIVDDEPANLRLLERLFRRNYQVFTAESGEEALRLIEQHDFPILITDQRMPGMTGIELLKATVPMRPHMVRIILTGYTDVGALVEAINCGHVYKYVAKPWDNDELRLTVERAVEHYEATRTRHELEQSNRRLAQRLGEMTRGVVRAIAEAVEARDPFISGHARRVSGYATAIGRRMRLDVARLEEISLAALLHDVGQIGTPDSVLLKSAALTPDERAVVRLHPGRGARILSSVPEMAEIAEIVRHHHEDFDGGGYPDGLAGVGIPLASRILRVADAYDAMTSPRPFRPAYGHDAALELLRAGAGTRFDPEVAAAFCGLEALDEVRRAVAAGDCGPRQSLAPPADRPIPFADLVGEIRNDPVLAARVLRLANGGGAEPTADIAAACARVGEGEVRSACRGVTREGHSEEAEALWSHSLRCAEAAAELAEHSRALPPEEAYTLGLLHDVGEFLLHSRFPVEMANILWLEDAVRAEREAAAFGVDHCQVGQWVLESCGLPARLTSAVLAHHDETDPGDPVALLLRAADAVARADDPGQVTRLGSLGPARLAGLRLTGADLHDIHGRAGAALAEEQPAGL